MFQGSPAPKNMHLIVLIQASELRMKSFEWRKGLVDFKFTLIAFVEDIGM